MLFYACSECSNCINEGDPGWRDWSCPDHPKAMVETIKRQPSAGDLVVVRSGDVALRGVVRGPLRMGGNVPDEQGAIVEGAYVVRVDREDWPKVPNRGDADHNIAPGIVLGRHGNNGGPHEFKDVIVRAPARMAMNFAAIETRISKAFRAAFEAHADRTEDPGYALSEARNAASALVPDNIVGSFDDESLTFRVEGVR